jgi:hypothetical protein
MVPSLDLSSCWSWATWMMTGGGAADPDLDLVLLLDTGLQVWVFPRWLPVLVTAVQVFVRGVKLRPVLEGAILEPVELPIVLKEDIPDLVRPTVSDLVGAIVLIVVAKHAWVIGVVCVLRVIP